MKTRRRVIAAALLAAGVTACGGRGHPLIAGPTTTPQTAAPTTASTVPTTTTTVPATTTTTTPPSPIDPLTGLAEPSAAQAQAPAVVVKIDNVDGARPQTGLNQADVVYEELVEGGLTRLAAVFQSTYPAQVGPVRSGRLTDITLVDDLNHPVFAYSGTNGIFLPQIRSQPIDDVDGENHGTLYWRAGPHPSPHDLYTNIAVDAATDQPAAPPPALFTFRAAGTPLTNPGVAPASSVTVKWPEATATWTFSASTGLWDRAQNGTPDVDTARQQIAVANVVIQAVPYVTSLIASGEGVADAPIPEGELIGTGPAWIVSGSQIVQGTWSRSSLGTVTTFTDSTGQPIALLPGRTWVELIQSGTAPKAT